jgi:hypothetical protein
MMHQLSFADDAVFDAITSNFPWSQATSLQSDDLRFQAIGKPNALLDAAVHAAGSS